VDGNEWLYNIIMKLIHFTADWCGPCKKLKPLIDEYVKTNFDIEYVKIDIDADPATANKYDVMAIPTLILTDGESIMNRHTGVMTKVELDKFCQI